MSNTETVQKAINFIKNVNAAADDLCPKCLDRIRQQLKLKRPVGDQPTSRHRSKTTGAGVNYYYDQNR